jgi:formylglycine-generating enzyme required for sulfatase activity
MHGNLAEWCQDCQATYSDLDQSDPVAISSDREQIWRGGSCFNPDRDCRSAFRGRAPSNSRSGSRGFRIVAIPAPPPGANVAELARPATAGTATGGVAKAAVPGVKTLQLDLGNGISMEFVQIHPGIFMMGGESPGTKPVHIVTIGKPFHMSKCEVTQEQWEHVMGNNPSKTKSPKHPVESVTWHDCRNFTVILKDKAPGYRFALPTEAQWEYACRAGSTTRFCYGEDEVSLGEYAWYSLNSGTTHPVGERKPNAWGLYDMHGNVSEWCQDWAGPYTGEPQTDPAGPPDGSNRIVRAGAYASPSGYCQSARRLGKDPRFKDGTVGFRIVCYSER